MLTFCKLFNQLTDFVYTGNIEIHFEGAQLSDKKKKWMGYREYGRHRNISLHAVQDQIKKGLLTVKNGALKETKNGSRIRVSINCEIADKLWDEKVLATAQNMHSHPAHKPDANHVEGEGGLKGPSYSQSRTIKEAFAAKTAQIDYEKKAGNLCKTEDVSRAARDMARTTRDYLLNMPGKLAPLLAAETDISEVHRLIEEEIHNALTNISSGKIF